MSQSIRLYHFVEDKYGLQNIQKRRLKLSFADRVNDLFELRPFDFGEGKLGRELRKAWDATIVEHAKSQGFISFSEDWDVPTMWAHYAKNHAGICLGFDVPEEHGEKIRYERKLRPIDTKFYSDMSYRTETIEYSRTTKSNHWEYEKEWRCWFGLTEAEKIKNSQIRTSYFSSNSAIQLFCGRSLLGIDLRYRHQSSKHTLKQLTMWNSPQHAHPSASLRWCPNVTPLCRNKDIVELE